MAAVGDDTINKEADDGDVPVGAGGTTKLLDEGDASTTASRLRGVPGGVVVVARDAVRVRVMLARCLGRMAKQQAGAAFLTWSRDVAAARAARSVWARAVAKLAARALAMALGGWRSNTREQQQRKHPQQQQWRWLKTRSGGSSSKFIWYHRGTCVCSRKDCRSRYQASSGHGYRRAGRTS